MELVSYLVVPVTTNSNYVGSVKVQLCFRHC